MLVMLAGIRPQVRRFVLDRIVRGACWYYIGPVDRGGFGVRRDDFILLLLKAE